MTSFLTKWLISSLLMPLAVLLFGKYLNLNLNLNLNLILLFWPGSIVLMSLGAENRPITDIIYVWVVGVCLNILLYLLIGIAFYFLLRYIKLNN